MVVVAVTAICVALFGVIYVRGTWATATPQLAESVKDGVRVELIKTAEGDQAIQTSVVLPVSVADAWRVLSNYEEWEKLFKTLRRKSAEQVAENKHHVQSDVLTPMGTIHLDFVVTHEPTSTGGYLAHWDAPTRELPVNRGTIVIEPRGEQETVLVYTVFKKYRQYPQFLVNNMLYSHQRDIVGTLRERIVELARQP